MMGNDYLIMGIDGLSRAHEGNYFNDGHLAASVIAARYFCDDNSCGAEVQNSIRYRIEHDLKDDVLLRPAPDEAAD